MIKFPHWLRGMAMFAVLTALLVYFVTGYLARSDESPPTPAPAEKVTLTPTLASALPTSEVLAQDFTLTDLNGKQVSLKDQRGQVVLLNFWATW